MDADPIAYGLCAWLLTYALHSTVLVGAAWSATAVSARLRSSRGLSTAVRERLWRAALLGGLATASVQIATGFAPFSVRWTLAEPVEPLTSFTLLDALAPHAPHASSTRQEQPLAALTRFAASPPRALHPAVERAGPQAPFVPVLLAEPTHAPSAPAGPVAREAHTTLPAVWVRALVSFWLAGAILGAAFWAFEWRRLFRRLRGRSPIAYGTARAVFEDLLARTGVHSAVRLSSAAGIAAPITFGLRRAEICLPPRTVDGLRREELEALLAHELAHAVRRDSAWLIVYRVIEILFFFQPLNRLARIRLQDDAEYLCDDWAVVHTGERVALASCLTEIAGWILHERRPLLVPAMAARGSRLSLRVRRLLDEAHRPVRAVPLRGLSALAVSAVAAVTFFAPGVDAESRSAGEPSHDSVFAFRGEAAEVDLARDEEPRSEDLDLHFSPDEAPDEGDVDPGALADAFDSALALQALADEIGALGHDFDVLASRAGGAPEPLHQRVLDLRLRLSSLRARQARVEALVQLQAQAADARRAPLGVLDDPAGVPNE